MDGEPAKPRPRRPSGSGAGPRRKEGGTNGVSGNKGHSPAHQNNSDAAEEEGEDEEEEEGLLGDDDGVADGDEFFEDEEEEDEAPSATGEGETKPRNTLASLDWDETYACPLEVHFTQEKIHPFFHRRGPIVNVLPKIRPMLRSSDKNDEEAEIELLPPFPPIHCLKNGEDFWTLDNRRLYALQLVAMEHWPQRCRVKILSRQRLPRQRFRTQYRKFSTTTGGRDITVCARYQKFDNWSWFGRAVEYEWWTFSQRLGCLLSAFEILPVVGALLFRTGLTGFSSRLPLVVGFILAFACDLLRQRVPVLEKRLCELHVQAIMDGEVRPLVPCLSKSFAALRERLWNPEEVHHFNGPLSMAQLAATLALAMLLTLPYILGIAGAKLRSSLLSCWLGVACVLAVQLGSALRAGAAAPPRLSPQSSGGGASPIKRAAGDASDD